MQKIILTIIGACFSLAALALPYQPQPQMGTAVMPQGSYTQTCSNCSMDTKDTLFCSCADRNGTPRNTILPNARYCQSVDNIDGQLTCTQQQRRWPFKHPHRPKHTVDIQAGPIWNQSNAQQVCPSVCQSNRGTWTGQWNTTVWGQMSVCQCQLY